MHFVFAYLRIFQFPEPTFPQLCSVGGGGVGDVLPTLKGHVHETVASFIAPNWKGGGQGAEFFLILKGECHEIIISSPTSFPEER